MNCCKKCRCDGFEQYKGNALEQTYAPNCACECHTPKDVLKEWEARFDEVFLGTMYKDSGYSEERAVLKSFIHSLLHAQRSELVERIEGLKNPFENDIQEYNAALQDVQALLRDETV